MRKLSSFISRQIVPLVLGALVVLSIGLTALVWAGSNFGTNETLSVLLIFLVSILINFISDVVITRFKSIVYSSRTLDESLEVPNNSPQVEVEQQGGWYLPISNVIKIDSNVSIEQAFSTVRRPVVVHNQIMDFHHLVVVKENTDDIIGIINEEQLEQAILVNPISSEKGIRLIKPVELYMSALPNIPRFTSSMSKQEVRQALVNDEIWENYQKIGAAFVEDKTGKIIGLVSDYNLLKD